MLLNFYTIVQLRIDSLIVIGFQVDINDDPTLCLKNKITYPRLGFNNISRIRYFLPRNPPRSNFAFSESQSRTCATRSSSGTRKIWTDLQLRQKSSRWRKRRQPRLSLEIPPPPPIRISIRTCRKTGSFPTFPTSRTRIYHRQRWLSSAQHLFWSAHFRVCICRLSNL